MEKAVVLVLVSGGVDSTTLLHYVVKELGREVKALTILYGQKHSKEIECSTYQCNLLGVPFEIIDLSLLAPYFSSSSLVGKEEVPDVVEVMGDPQPSTYVPNRNMLFLALAAAYAENLGIQEVYYGAQKHDLYGYWDTTPQFLQALNDVFSLNRKNGIQILAPFVDYTKTDVVRKGLELGVDYAHTWSDYFGREKASRHSATSAERLKAFAELGIEDPLEYED